MTSENKEIKRKRKRPRNNENSQEDSSYDDDRTAGSISDQTKKALVNIRRVKELRQDPFLDEHNEKLEEVCKYISSETKKYNDNIVLNPSYEPTLKLAEAGLLLYAVTNSIYSRQVNSLYDDIQQLVAFITGTEPPVKKGRKKKEIPNENNPTTETQENKLTEEIKNPDEKLGDDGVAVEKGAEQDTKEEKNVENEETSMVTDGGDENHNHDSEGNIDSITVPEQDPNISSEHNQDDKDKDPNLSPKDDNNSTENNPEAKVDPSTNNLEDAQNTLENKPVENCENTSGVNNDTSEIPAKKRKYERRMPMLSPYYDIDKSEKTYANRAKPPLLTAFYLECKQRIAREKKPKENNEEEKKKSEDEKDDKNSTEENKKEETSNEISTIEEKKETIVESENIEINSNKPDEINTLIKNSEFIVIEGLKIGTEKEVCAEDQIAIQNYFSQLEKLFIRQEKSVNKSEIDNIFDSTFSHLSNICKKYDTTLNRIDSTPQKSNVALEPQKIMDTYLESVNGISHELFHSSTLDSLKPEAIQVNTTILQKTNEKSMAEAKKRCQDMLRSLQSIIVRQFRDYQMIAEHSPEFIRRVLTFERKMGRLLDSEKLRGGDFDVRKYEMEVLETALSKCEEQERISELDSELDIQVASPLSNCEHDEEICQFTELPSPSIPFQASSACSPERSSLSSGSGAGSNKWIGLSEVFAGLNTKDNVQVARRFYAVLALLSFQNLDINYDHFDPLLTKNTEEISQLSQSQIQTGNISRALKILASRCSDIDKEEIFISPLTNKSRTESFREDLEMQCNDKDSQQSSSGYSSQSSPFELGHGKNGDTDNIISEFIEEDCMQYLGSLFGKRRSRKSK